MRHRKTGKKLGRTGSHRNAMFRNMVTSLLKHGKIKTTDTKAKELRRWADHIITLAKRGDLHARRQALAIVREKNVVHKLFEDAGQQFGARNGGYTRLTKIGVRPGDAAPMTLVELITGEGAGKKKKKTKKQQPAAKPATESAAAPEAEAPAAETAEEATAEAEEAASEVADEEASDSTDASAEDASAEAAEEAPEEPAAEAAEETKAEDATEAPEAPAEDEEDAGDAKDEEEPKE
ncbi:MAG: 50S ribosomal protein L17 [Thermodesulfobacteriota bacterium]|nr:50S ribosomal protein L17 [Thermodesulfobacteriota bacterium]